MPEPLDFEEDYEPPRKRGLSGCWIAAILVGVLGLLGVVAVVGGLAYLGTKVPETSVYAGAQMPSEYLETLREVDALAPGEEVIYFYTDGAFDIRDGFYFVSDRKVAVYIDGTAQPLQAVAFENIEAAELLRETSFFIDSQITLTLSDGSTLFFPVSSEMNRDELFHEAIVERLE